MIYNLLTTRPKIKNYGKSAISLNCGYAQAFDEDGSGADKIALDNVKIVEISADCIVLRGYEAKPRGLIFQEWILTVVE